MDEKIGSFLVIKGLMTAGQVDEVLRIQSDQAEHRLFGVIAIELGFIDEASILAYLVARADY